MARRRSKAEINIMSNTAFLDAMANTIGALVFILLMVTVVTVAIKLDYFELNIQTGQKLPDAIVGKSYDMVLASIGGNEPYHWKLTNGSLPKGLYFEPEKYMAKKNINPKENSSGKVVTGIKAHIKGIPEEATREPIRFELEVSSTAVIDEKTGQISLPAEQKLQFFEITVQPGSVPLSIKTNRLPDAIDDFDYSVILSAQGGMPPYTWKLENGPVDGIRVEPNEGRLYGRPKRTGRFQMSFVVQDQSGSVTRSLPVPFRVFSHDEITQEIEERNPGRIFQPLKIVTTMLPDATAGHVYSINLAAIGGQSAYLWSIINKPKNLSISSDGKITWTPSNAPNAQEYDLNVIVKAGNQEDKRVLKLVVQPEPIKPLPLKMFPPTD